MASLYSLNHLKVLLLTIVSLAVLLSVTNAAYTGLRYGKRESSETIGRVFPRSNAVRNIQARSTSGTRFYSGTRFGGKRAYWQPAAELVENADSLPSNLPYECIHIPFIGVRCTRMEENYWSNYNNNMNNNNDEDQLITNEGFESDGSGSPSASASAVSGP